MEIWQNWSPLFCCSVKEQCIFVDLLQIKDKFTVAHKGHAANKKETLQTKKKRCKQKRNAANKKETLQTKEKRYKQKRNAANK